MIKFENTVTPSAEQWRAAIMGARNPMNSWQKSDSAECRDFHCSEVRCPFDFNGDENCYDRIKPDDFIIGPNDLSLLKRLCSAGTDHRKFMRMLPVMVTITAPLYWWKEFSTYKVGTVANSCSTMHKIADKEFTLEDFSTEHLYSDELEFFKEIVDHLNGCRNLYLDSKKNGSPRDVKNDWWQMIQLLPSSYNQKRTIMLNYEVLANIYKSRKNHKLDEWREHSVIIGVDVDHRNYSNMGFCDWIKMLPYSELITGIEPGKKQVCKDCFGAEMDDCDKCPHKTKK